MVPPVVNALNVASFDCLVTVSVYVCVAIPSCAVTTILMILSPIPSAKLMVAPDVTVVPFTFTVALLLETVGVRLIVLVALLTVWV